MRNKISMAFVGIVFILLGVAIIGNAFDAWNFTIFFDGWWTLFIIVPCVASMINNGVNSGNVIGLTIGVLLLTWQQQFIEKETMGKLILPAILILLGLYIIFKGFVKKNSPSKIAVDPGQIDNVSAILGGCDRNYSNIEFNGAECAAVFGGIGLNLKSAIITSDCKITCSAVFGGIEILLPADVKLKISSTPILGGVENKFVSTTNPDAPTIFIEATAIFGGIDIK